MRRGFAGTPVVITMCVTVASRTTKLTGRWMSESFVSSLVCFVAGVIVTPSAVRLSMSSCFFRSLPRFQRSVAVAISASRAGDL